MTIPPSGLTRTMSKLGTTTPAEPGACGVPVAGAADPVVLDAVPPPETVPPVLSEPVVPELLPAPLEAELPEVVPAGATALPLLEDVWLVPALGWIVAGTAA